MLAASLLITSPAWGLTTVFGPGGTIGAAVPDAAVLNGLDAFANFGVDNLAVDLLGGTLNVFEAARKLGHKHVLYMSSAGVYGPDQGHTPEPTTLYGAYKLAGEGAARAYLADHGGCTAPPPRRTPHHPGSKSAG